MLEAQDPRPATDAVQATHWRRGLAQAAPIVLGYVPIGFAYGVLARESGLSAQDTVLMSLVVYAGAAQFIAAGLFAAGVSPLSIVVTTFIVNIRHTLLSASLAPHLRRWRPPTLAAFAYQLTDETFAVHAVRFRSGAPDRVEAFLVNTVSHAAWISGSWLGAIGGTFVPDARRWGLDYALPALFLALLVPQLQSRRHTGVALCTGATVLALSVLGLAQWAVLLATIVGATLGVVWERWTRCKSV
ncbi:MAG: AzlC family ABC transporter permease [Anaerolineae bacterium]|nr:AzlC family ABC transporter permease [Anaerolineae bacterium]